MSPLNICTNSSKSMKIKHVSFFVKTMSRSLSYVEKCNYIQAIKKDPVEYVSLIPKAKHLVFRGSKPLITKNTGNSLNNASPKLTWLHYSDLLKNHETLLTSSILLDVDETKTPLSVVQLGKVADNSSGCDLAEETDSEFLDLRLAMFSLSWNDAQLLSKANSLLMFHKRNLFCGSCGSRTERSATGNCRRCNECAEMFYPSSQPVGIVLVSDPSGENAVLVRSKRQPRSVFSCIAGFSDVGEDLEATVKREVAEEVGLEVREVLYVASQHWPFPSSLMFGCFAVATKEPLTLDESELAAGKWFSREEISSALQTVRSNPRVFFQSKTTEGFLVPPQGAIAHHLIYHWLNRTPVEKIKYLIK